MRFIILLIAVLSDFARAEAAPGKRGTPTPSFRPAARLSVKSPHLVGTVKGSLLEVRSLSVEIVNSGPETAEDVAVRARFSDGPTLPLRGPKKIPGRSTAVFMSTGRHLVASGKSPEVRASCATCKAR